MKIGGLLPFTLSDFPDHVAAILFTQGCNFRCPFCHNGALIPHASPPEQAIGEDEVMRFLAGRRGRLDGVVVSGGEPSLQPDLPGFLARVKQMDFRVKLDTNGSRPDVLRHVFDRELVDYVAMDVKAPFHRYSRLAGCDAPVESMRESIHLIAASRLPHEFRTTVVEPLLSERDLEDIRAMLPPGSRHRLQPFRRESALDASLRGAA